MKAAFQGVPGAYSEVALRSLLGERTQSLPCETFGEVFQAVERRKADCGVIPIENSLAGSIHQNYDLLLTHDLHIIGETHLRIEHVLMCHPRAKFPAISEVRSHPQALAQCTDFFTKNPRLRPVAYFDTAGAAKNIAETGDTTCAAIASEYAASLYGLKIVRHNIENESHNFTRFLVIARKPWKGRTTKNIKCSIAFTPVKNQVGILFRILGVFSLRDIDLLKIESRPDPSSPFEYLFYVDFAGSPKEKKVARALEHLQEMVVHYRMLGAYPAKSI